MDSDLKQRAWAGLTRTAIVMLIAGGGTVVSGVETEVDEQSVFPGINRSYLEPDQNVGEWVERFENEGREVFDHRHAIVDALGIRPGMQIADVGAGTGLFTLLLAEITGPSGRVFAVDIVPDFLEHIAEQSRLSGAGNVDTVLCTERSVELPEASVDLVYLCDVYHHFEYPRSSLASIHRALRPGGALVLVEFKRIPGESSNWILNHVRAGQEVVAAEIETAGFEVINELDLPLEQNYALRFRRVDG